MLINFIKNLLAILIMVLMIGSVYFNRDVIISSLDTIFFPKDEIIIKEANTYARSYVYEQYQMTNDFEPDNSDDLLNIFYTILNSGWDTFFFYCPDTYTNCTNDVTTIIKDETILSSINNYVSPYNSFSYFQAAVDNYGKVTVTPIYTYDLEKIAASETKLKAIEKAIITTGMTNRDKIRAFHDYIINHTKYDTAMVDKGINNYQANTAIGPLVYGYAICGGYSDAMAIFLDDLDITNYKIASTDHIWNYVNLDGAWYHLDLTWDDPVLTSGADRLIYTYFLINDAQLQKLNTSGNHTYNGDYY